MPDPVSKKEKSFERKSQKIVLQIFLLLCETKIILIPNCEEKDYYLSSHPYRTGFSRENTDSQCQHANTCKLHS